MDGGCKLKPSCSFIKNGSGSESNSSSNSSRSSVLFELFDSGSSLIASSKSLLFCPSNWILEIISFASDRIFLSIADWKILSFDCEWFKLSIEFSSLSNWALILPVLPVSPANDALRRSWYEFGKTIGRKSIANRFVHSSLWNKNKTHCHAELVSMWAQQNSFQPGTLNPSHLETV